MKRKKSSITRYNIIIAAIATLFVFFVIWFNTDDAAITAEAAQNYRIEVLEHRDLSYAKSDRYYIIEDSESGDQYLIVITGNDDIEILLLED